MTLEVRRATTHDDLDAAGRIVQRAYFALPGYPRDPHYDVVLGDVRTRVGESTVVVALLDGRVVGCLTFVAGPDDPHHEFDDDEATSFRYFGVDPAAQGHGVGEAMVQWVVDETARLGKARVRIHTLESMPGAQRLYQRMGFRRDPDLDENWDGILGLAYVRHL